MTDELDKAFALIASLPVDAPRLGASMPGKLVGLDLDGYRVAPISKERANILDQHMHDFMNLCAADNINAMELVEILGFLMAQLRTNVATSAWPDFEHKLTKACNYYWATMNHYKP